MSRLVVPWLLGMAGLSAQSPSPALEDFVADIQHLTKTVRVDWSYHDYRTKECGVDLQALEKEALGIVRKTPTKKGFLQALLRYSAGLKDGHSGVVYGTVPQVGFRRMPFSLVEAKEGILIFGLHEPMARDGKLRRGDLLVALDDRPIEQVIQDTERVIPASTDGARRRAAILRIYRYTEKKKVKVRIRRKDDGKEVQVEVDCPFASVGVPRHFVSFHRQEWKMLGKDIAFFRPASFSPPQDSGWHGASASKRDKILAKSYAEYERIFREILGRKPKALILDLRGNPGGTDLLGQRLASHLMKPGFVYFRLQAKSPMPWGGWRRPSSHKPRNVPEKLPRFLGRLVVLIDEGVFSTADNFAACLRDVHPDVTFAGRPVGAGTGAPRAVTLPKTGARVWFCTQRVYSPKGKMIEGRGVQPDVKVEWTRKDYLERRDPDLQEALRVARRGR
jgi:C-terminal processing protease CtpA/Prc